MNQKQNIKPPLSPNEYRKELKQVDLDKIQLESCSVKFKRERFSEDKEQIKIDVSSKVNYKIVNPGYAVFMEQFILTGTKTIKRDYIIKIDCTLSVTLKRTGGEFKEDFLKTYSMVNLNLVLWPYFREFVHNITYRLGIPPLILPFLKQQKL